MKKYLTLLTFAAALLLGSGTIHAQAADLISADAASKAAQAVVDGILVDAELDYELGVLVYEVEILDKAGYLHKIDINAFTGATEKQYREIMRPEKAAILSRAQISHSDAIQTALTKLPGADIIHSELDTKGGKAVYEIKMIDTKGLEHEAVVDAVSGKLLNVRQDEFILFMPDVTRAQAEEAAKQAVNGQILYTILDEDDGRTSYEVIMVSDGKLFEVNIDGKTGQVRRAEVDH